MAEVNDLVIRGGLVVFPNQVIHADIGISHGKISAIADSGQLHGSEVLDASGLIVIPGAVDMHVHFREPGTGRKEDFLHGTAAAACGGVTTVADMPNTSPSVCTADRFAAKAQQVAKSAWVDFALWAGGTDVVEIQAMAKLGAVGLKVYMVGSKGANSPYSDELAMPDDGTFFQVLEASARLGWPVCVHLGNPSLEQLHRDRLKTQGRNDAAAFCDSLRGLDAYEAARRVLLFAAETGAHVHLAHLSHGSARCLEALLLARARGVAVTGETPAPALSMNELDRLGPFGIPFAFTEEEADRFWQAIADGTIDAVATDHAPHAREEKEIGFTDIWKAPPGYPAVETSLPLMFDAILSGRLALERMVKVMAENPARILRLPGKGRIALGSDADLVFLDPEAERVIDEGKLHSKCGWSPFHGRKLHGGIRLTMLGGHVIARDGELVGPSPQGKMLKPSVQTLGSWHEESHASRIPNQKGMD